MKTSHPQPQYLKQKHSRPIFPKHPPYLFNSLGITSEVLFLPHFSPNKDQQQKQKRSDGLVSVLNDYRVLLQKKEHDLPKSQDTMTAFTLIVPNLSETQSELIFEGKTVTILYAKLLSNSTDVLVGIPAVRESKITTLLPRPASRLLWKVNSIFTPSRSRHQRTQTWFKQQQKRTDKICSSWFFMRSN